MERKVNEIITYNHKDKIIHLKVISDKDNTCKGCFFNENTDCDVCETIRNTIGYCSNEFRSDNTSIIFKQINNKNYEKDY